MRKLQFFTNIAAFVVIFLQLYQCFSSKSGTSAMSSVFGTRCCHHFLNKETNNSVEQDPIPSDAGYVADTVIDRGREEF